MRVKSLQLCLTFAILWTRQTPLSMGFSRQEYWSGLPCLPPGDLPDPGIEPKSPTSPALQVNSSTEPLGKPINNMVGYLFETDRTDMNDISRMEISIFT